MSIVSFGQPACAASAGSHSTFPCLNTIFEPVALSSCLSARMLSTAAHGCTNSDLYVTDAVGDATLWAETTLAPMMMPTENKSIAILFMCLMTLLTVVCLVGCLAVTSILPTEALKCQKIRAKSTYISHRLQRIEKNAQMHWHVPRH